MAAKILVVDDQDSVRDFLSECLCSMGYETFAASDAHEALEIYHDKSGEIALVITDMTMPEISGIELAVKLYESDQNVRIILATGYDTSTITAMPPSIIGIMAKPYSVPDLFAVVEKALQPIPSNLA